MRDHEPTPIPTSNHDAHCAQRESAQSVLRSHADRLRRQAGQLHQEADRVEQLANFTIGISGPAEEAMWRLAINSIQNAAPRLY